MYEVARSIWRGEFGLAKTFWLVLVMPDMISGRVIDALADTGPALGFDPLSAMIISTLLAYYVWSLISTGRAVNARLEVRTRQGTKHGAG